MKAPSQKQSRQRAILEVIRKRSVSSQEALGQELADRGHEVAQSTLSRDLKELRIARVHGETGYRYAPTRESRATPTPEEADLSELMAAEIVGVECNEVTVVLRTRVGRAQGVAVYLDRHRPAGILATVAGDDTVLVVPESIKDVEILAARLSGLFDSTAHP